VPHAALESVHERIAKAMAEGTFATAINCMDGRVQTPVADWVKNYRQVQYVDMITDAGIDGVLARGSEAERESIKRRVLISVNTHHSDSIAIAGHHGCAGNPVSPAEHLADIKMAMQIVSSWNLPVQVTGLWVNEWGSVEVIGD
jgi:hypothetical protein